MVLVLWQAVPAAKMDVMRMLRLESKVMSFSLTTEGIVQGAV